MIDFIHLAIAPLLLAGVLFEPLHAVVIATLPSNPRLIISGQTDDPLDYIPLIIDFDSNGVGDVFMLGNGPAIEFHVAEGNRALVLRPPPPNLGGLLVNLPLGFNLTGLLNGSVYWYGGFPNASVAELIGIPLNSNVVSFGGTANNGNEAVTTGFFNNNSGYFGIEFKIDEATHYGWVHVSNETGLGSGGFIDAWAYETDAGVGISVGAVPEPSVAVMMLFVVFAVVTRRSR